MGARNHKDGNKWTLEKEPYNPVKRYRYKKVGDVWVRQMTIKELAAKMGIGHLSVQKVENDYVTCPSNDFFCRWLALTDRDKFFELWDYFAEKYRS